MGPDGGGPRAWRLGVMRAPGGRWRPVWAWRATAAAVLAALALTGPGLAGTAQAAYPGQDGLIAFLRGGNVYTIQSDGSGLTKLTSDGHDSGPRWSPDGQQIAYLDRGNLWMMSAGGGDKTQLTTGTRYADSRPSWSPNGRYLAFVKTRRGRAYGYLTRYNLATHGLATFSVPYHSEKPTRRQVQVTALPAPVAWGWAANGTEFGSFILFEGTGHPFCRPHYFCLDAYGRPHQDQYKNGFPSSEWSARAPVRIADPDWFPGQPQFDTDVLTSQEHCSAATCTHSGIHLQVLSSLIVPGAYDAVYSPVGRNIAYVLNVRGRPEIYVGFNASSPDGALLTAGSQPDWQPLPPG
jgi:hypothetical protein